MVSGDNFQFGFSILILSMIIIGGLGSIWARSSAGWRSAT